MLGEGGDTVNAGIYLPGGLTNLWIPTRAQPGLS